MGKLLFHQCSLVFTTNIQQVYKLPTMTILWFLCALGQLVCCACIQNGIMDHEVSVVLSVLIYCISLVTTETCLN